MEFREKMAERKVEKQLKGLYYDVIDCVLDITERANARNLEHSTRELDIMLNYGIQQYGDLKTQNPHCAHLFEKYDRMFNRLFDDIRGKIEKYNSSFETPTDFTR